MVGAAGRRDQSGSSPRAGAEPANFQMSGLGFALQPRPHIDQPVRQHGNIEAQMPRSQIDHFFLRGEKIRKKRCELISIQYFCHITVPAAMPAAAAAMGKCDESFRLRGNHQIAIQNYSRRWNAYGYGSRFFASFPSGFHLLELLPDNDLGLPPPEKLRRWKPSSFFHKCCSLLTSFIPCFCAIAYIGEPGILPLPSIFSAIMPELQIAPPPVVW
jgi:hypothetical protein